MQKKSQLVENQQEKISYTAQVFAELLRFTGKNARQFALETGISEEQISKLLKGKRNSVTGKVADKVLEHYPEISRAWLLSGEGDMLNNVSVSGDGNIANGNGNTAHVGVSASDIVKQLDVKDEQIDRLLAIIERMQGA